MSDLLGVMVSGVQISLLVSFSLWSLWVVKLLNRQCFNVGSYELRIYWRRLGHNATHNTFRGATWNLKFDVPFWPRFSIKLRSRKMPCCCHVWEAHVTDLPTGIT